MPTSRALISGFRSSSPTSGTRPLRFPHLARAIDPRYRSNLHALIFAGLAGLVLFVGSTGDGFGPAFNLAWRAGVATIGVWALCRELDPDHPSSAGLAAGLSIPAWVVFGIPDLIAVFAVVITARVLLRPTGHAPHFLDYLMLLGLGVAAGRTSPGWLLGLVLAFAVARDRGLEGEPSHGARLTALAIATGTTAMAVRSSEVSSGLGGLIPVIDPQGPSLAIITLVVLGFVAAVFTPPYAPISKGDLSKQPLSARRLQSARRITLAGAIIVILITRQAGMVATAPLWLAWIGIALVARRIVPLPLGPDTRRR